MRSLRFVLGSCAVYAIVAACSGSGAGPALGFDGGADARGSHDGPSILDSLTDPVPEAAADPYQSGSRLKAKYYAGADGSKEFIGWHDSLMNNDCSFRTAADGMVRCLPTSASGGVYWGNAQCTQLLAAVPIGCPQPTYVTSTSGSGACGPFTVHLFTTGPMITPGPMIYVGTGPQDCTGQPSTNVSGIYDFYPSDLEQDPTTYVAATMQTEP
jgi:hypothetical protein